MFKNSIHHEDILQEVEYLVNNKVIENKQLEYKSELPGNDDKSIINCLLKPVCSFANTNDGFIIYGVKEKNGVPTEIVGVSLENIDEAKRRIEHLIRDNTEDQITGTDIAVYKLSNQDRYVVILKVRKSWYGPHRETKNNRFYARHSSGSYIMDLAEIKNAVNLSANLLDNVNKFKIGRLSDIEARQTITPIENGACMVLHVVSLPAFMSGKQCGMDQLLKIGDLFLPKNIHISGWSKKIVLEGLLGINPLARSTDRYDLVFRTGRIESVTVFPTKQQFDDSYGSFIPSGYCERLLIADTKRFLEMLKILNFQPPIVIFLSYLGIGSYSLAGMYNKLYKFDRNMLQLSSEVIEHFDVKLETVLQPLFDSVWHCCGLLKSENYNEAGEYVATMM